MTTADKVLFIGFRGINNSSARLAEHLSSHKFLLTNSFTGLKKDIDLLPVRYEDIFGVGIGDIIAVKRG